MISYELAKELKKAGWPQGSDEYLDSEGVIWEIDELATENNCKLIGHAEEIDRLEAEIEHLKRIICGLEADIAKDSEAVAAKV